MIKSQRKWFLGFKDCCGWINKGNIYLSINILVTFILHYIFLNVFFLSQTGDFYIFMYKYGNFSMYGYLQNVTKHAWAARAQTQTSAFSVRRDWFWTRTRYCAAWRGTRRVLPGPTSTTTSSPAWGATSTATPVKGPATTSARPAPSPDIYTVSSFS